jgi:23S rRNA (guanine2535-N1)-methyltransferase
MPYQFAKENRDFSDYASGRVFYSAPGHPAFPVRLISEVFQRCQKIRSKMGVTTPAVLYDPCCGSAYHLSTLAYLHWHEIDTIIGSDIDANIISIADKNLGLLTLAGLEKRAAEIAAMQIQFGKSSHMAAAKSANQLRNELWAYLPTHSINTYLFVADATDSHELRRTLKSKKFDIIITDIPYGRQSKWQSTNEDIAANESLLQKMLDTLLEIITSDTVVAIITNKAQKCEHNQYKRMGKFQIGKRRITLLQLVK